MFLFPNHSKSNNADGTPALRKCFGAVKDEIEGIRVSNGKLTSSHGIIGKTPSPLHQLINWGFRQTQEDASLLAASVRKCNDTVGS